MWAQKFSSTHYSGREIDTYYGKGEPWKKVLGPAFVYLNSVSSPENPRALWEDAKQQVYIYIYNKKITKNNNEGWQSADKINYNPE